MWPPYFGNPTSRDVKASGPDRVLSHSVQPGERNLSRTCSLPSLFALFLEIVKRLHKALQHFCCRLKQCLRLWVGDFGHILPCVRGRVVQHLLQFYSVMARVFLVILHSVSHVGLPSESHARRVGIPCLFPYEQKRILDISRLQC